MWRFLLIVGLVFVPVAGFAQEVTAPIFPLSVGIPAEGNIGAATPSATFRFTAPANAAVTLTLRRTSGDLDPFLALFDPNGIPIGQNDDFEPTSRDARLEVQLDVAGTYTVEAARFDQAAGTTSGTYRLTLEIEGVSGVLPGLDPLSRPPQFGVAFTQLGVGEFTGGALDEQNPRSYFAVGGESGSLLRAIATTASGDLVSEVNLLDNNLNVIGESQRPREGEYIAFAALQRRDWVLIEVSRTDGAGEFSLYVDTIAGQPILYNNPEPTIGDFSNAMAAQLYTFEGTIGDQVFVGVAVTDGVAALQVRLLDVARRELASAIGTTATSLQARLPRSGLYILEITNNNSNGAASFNLRVNASEADATKISAQEATYNSAYKGSITNSRPINYYRFVGKAGEIITAEMRAVTGGLDPYMLLLDGELNELILSDNTRNSLNARINQFQLPADGEYYLLASRALLENGETVGGYDLALSAGAISLETGSLTATVTWLGDDDLNLFVREPSGRIISWSNPETANGRLQIDSNTNCEALSTQPVEHLYWDLGTLPPNGDYQLWVWYQRSCGGQQDVDFTLSILAEERDILTRTATLAAGERYNVDLRLSAPTVFLLGDPRITEPSAQQNASEGGDTPILIGIPTTGQITNDVYARFYQFNGNADQTVVIRAERVTGNLDPIVILRDDNERTLIQNDDRSPDNRNAQVTYTLPADGRYVVVVTRFGVRDGLTAGDYRLSLNVAESP